MDSILYNLNDGKSIFKNISIKERIEALKKLKSIIKENEEKISEALFLDLGKSKFEAFTTEIGVLYLEINFALKNIKKWTKIEKVKTDLTQFPSKCFILREPFGKVLIIAPWNYPFQLLMSPLIGAISAGNTAILKPSELSSYTSKVVFDIITKNFNEDYIKVVEGGIEETTKLLSMSFDYIFFTGGVNIGKAIMSAAAKYLTPVTLELGGKSPVIVDKSARLKDAVEKIVWGKFLNSGQTCVAPDFVYVHEDIEQEFLELLKQTIVKFYGANPEVSEDYSRIINQKHFHRLINLIDPNKIFHGGKYNEQNKYIEPTILTGVSWDDKVMQEEIFGPILPILIYKDIIDVVCIINKQPKPLALYVFTENKTFENKILNEISFGGGGVNSTIMQVVSSNLPFGGVGSSGMGSYHGKFGFDLFSHKKSIIKNCSRFNFTNIVYPNKHISLKFLKMIMK